VEQNDGFPKVDLEKAELHKYFNFILNKKYLFKILIRFSRGSQEQNL
jgi:hypothetical protein